MVHTVMMQKWKQQADDCVLVRFGLVEVDGLTKARCKILPVHFFHRVFHAICTGDSFYTSKNPGGTFIEFSCPDMLGHESKSIIIYARRAPVRQLVPRKTLEQNTSQMSSKPHNQHKSEPASVLHRFTSKHALNQKPWKASRRTLDSKSMKNRYCSKSNQMQP